MKSNRYIKLIVLSIFFFIVIFCLIHFKVKLKDTYKNALDSSGYNSYKNILVENYKSKFFDQKFLSCVAEVVKNRYIIDNRQEYGILIGKNKKELENGYFDIKFCIEENDLNIFVNKLFKDDFSIYYKNSLDNAYLSEFIDLIILLTNISLDENSKNAFKSAIVESYINIRSVENVDKIEDKNIDKCISFKEFDIKIRNEDNMLKISL